MGTLTNTEMQDEIRSSLGNRTDLDARLERFLNLAQMRIARKHKWEELKNLLTTATGFTSTPADDKFLVIPTGTRTIYSIVLIDGENSRKLIGYTEKEFEKTIPYPERYDTDRPSIFTRWGSSVEFWRVPDAVYVLEIRRSVWPTVFSTGSQTSDLDRKDDMIIMLALAWANASLSKRETATYYWRIYSNMINDAIGEERENPDIDITNQAVNRDFLNTGEYWKNPFVIAVR